MVSIPPISPSTRLEFVAFLRYLSFYRSRDVLASLNNRLTKGTKRTKRTKLRRRSSRTSITFRPISILADCKRVVKMEADSIVWVTRGKSVETRDGASRTSSLTNQRDGMRFTRELFRPFGRTRRKGCCWITFRAGVVTSQATLFTLVVETAA